MFETIPQNIRILNVTSGAGAATLRTLVDTALAAKSGAAAVLPRGKVIQIALTPGAAITVSDAVTGDGAPVAINTRVIYPCVNGLDKLKLTGAATVSVEMYFDVGGL